MLRNSRPPPEPPPSRHKGLVARLFGWWLIHKILGGNQ